MAEEERRELALKRAAEASRTIRELAAEYVEHHCRPHQRRWKQVEFRLKNHVVPAWGDRSASAIRRADIVELLDSLQHEKGLRQQVNRTRSTLSSMFDYAVEREYITENPVIGTRVRKVETERNRILSDQEIRAIWLAIGRFTVAHNPSRPWSD